MIKILNDPKIQKNFKLSEFVCRCGCGSMIYEPEVTEALQKVRDVVGSITVAVGFRCPEFNKRVKGASPNSRHMSGLAADIKSAKYTVYELARECYRAGFRGIGISDNKKAGSYYVHVDLRETPTFWTYDKNNASHGITKEAFLKMVGLG